MGEKIILHCDCNSFFASVETLLRPELNKVPMAVCGDPESRHGIILAKNELAKAYNIQTAETIHQAKRKCPHLVLVPPHHDEYVKYSKLVNEIYLTKTDLVEPFGIDESWLDVTNTAHLFGSGEEIANSLREEVRQQLGITISVGVSFNKIFAKLGSDYKKPDATTVFDKATFKQKVWALPVDALLYVGDSAQKSLSSIYVKTIGELAQCDRKQLEIRLGKLGPQLWDYANGLDDSIVKSFYEATPPKSIGNGITFKRNLVGEEEIKMGTGVLCDEVAFRLRNHKMLCGTVSVSIKDTSLKVISRQRQLDTPTAISNELQKAAIELVHEHWDMINPVRMITITAMSLVNSEQGEQISLFSDNNYNREKQLNLENTLDTLRSKYGRDSVSKGSRIDSDIGVYDPSDNGKKSN